MHQEGARKGHLSPWLTLSRGSGCPWRSIGGGRGRYHPRGHRLLPRQLPALEALDSVWKAVLRELEGRVVDWVCFRGGPGPAFPLRTAWLQLAPWLWVYSEQGHLGFLPAQLPPLSGRMKRRNKGSKKKPGTFRCLGKADPQEHPALVVLPPEDSEKTRSGCQGRDETTRGHLGGCLLKEAMPQAGCWGKGRPQGWASWVKGL